MQSTNNEQIYYDFTVDTSMLDEHAVMTIEGYQRIIITTTEKELKRINMEIATLIKEMGVSWVLLSLTVKILKNITPGQNLKIRTNHVWKKGVIYRRDFEITCAKTGEVMALAASFSAVLDINKRRICMDRAVYEKLSLPETTELFPAESRYTPQGEFDFCEEVAVRPCWIDSLGHVNNFRYGELTFDNIPQNLALNSKNICRIEMFFTGELRLNQSVKIYSRANDNHCFEVKGEHLEGGNLAFVTRIFYNE